MSGTQSWALQKAVFSALTGNALLLALLGGAHIHDRVPADATLPYVTLGDGVWRDWSTSTETGAMHDMRLHIWVRDGGRRRVRDISDALHACLHDQSLSLESGVLINLRFTQAQILTDPDGETWHGIVSFRAVTDAT